MGYGHSIGNTSDSECRLLIVFNSGNYEEISLSSWLAYNSDELVATNLNLPTDVVRKFPVKEAFILSVKKL